VADRSAACEQLSPYVLGALSSRETSAFEAHLSGCSACQTDKRLFDEVFAALARTAPPATPAPEVRDRVLASVRAQEELLHPATDARLEHLRQFRTREPRIWSALAAAAAVLVTVALGSEEVRVRRLTAYSESAMAVLAAPDLTRIDLAGQSIAPRAAVVHSGAVPRACSSRRPTFPFPLPAARTSCGS
jgi:anti-sigma-K factor RskA